MAHSIRATAILGIALLAAAGCKKKEVTPPPAEPAAQAPAPATLPISIGAVTVGKSIDAQRMVLAPLTVLGTRDTVYVSVLTKGVGENATIGARWEYVKADGSTIMVNESSQTITTTGPAYTEFHITKASAWPAGKYRVTVTLNGAAGTPVEFEIK